MTLEPASPALQKFQSLLRELFQYDCADLDFGIYRILNERRGLFEDWLTQRLPAAVKQALAGGAAAQVDAQAKRLAELAAELREEYEDERIIDGDGRLREDIRGRTAREYRELWEARQAAGQPQDREAEIYNRLYDFFRRYYEDGDFLSLRRYGAEDAYAVPYNGQEVMLHWANRDQYYVKTGEHFTDYRFRAGTGSDAWHVEFRMRRAETDRDNAKSADKRYFFADLGALHLDAATRTLTVPVEWRAATSAEAAALPARNAQDAINADIEKKLLAAKPVKAEPTLKTALEAQAPGTGDTPRTVLAQHLRRYTRRNSSDFFIHKDLRGFLTRELDYWLKAEVLKLDTLLAGEQPARAWLQTLAILREVATTIIDFLARVEDFQKRLYEKRKFVTECHWCITLDHVERAGLTERLVEILNTTEGGKAQKAEWKKLFAIDEVKAEGGKSGWKEKVTAEFLRSQPFLFVDTHNLPREFTDALLGHVVGLDDITVSILIHGDNLQALRLTEERFKTAIDIAITDPPYNTGSDDFPYKDGFLHSSWMTMMADRLKTCRTLLRESGLLFVHIGDKNNEYRESHNLVRVLDTAYGAPNYVAQLVWKNKSGGGNDSDFFAQDHEYIFAYAHSRSHAVLRSDPDAQVTTSYNRSDANGSYALERLDKQSIRYSVTGDYVIVGPDGTEYRPRHKDPRKPNATWRWSKDKVSKQYDQLVFENGNVYTKNYKDDGAVPRSLLADERFGRTRTGKTELFSLFGAEVFRNPKPTKVERFLLNVGADDAAIVLDPFGGSGTVAHAAIAANRLDEGTRVSLMIEQGGHFDSVLRPRVLKAAYSSEWVDGKPVKRDGISAVVKYLRLESYEDTLSNLRVRKAEDTQPGFDFDAVPESYRLGYWLDVETAGSASLLDVEKLEQPFDYRLRVHDGRESREQAVDLVETFNYLIGLIVRRRRVLDRDGRRYVLVLGRTRADNAPTAVLWRDIAGWTTDDFAAERDWLAAQSPFEDASVIYVNGDSALPGAQSLDPIFHARMFAPVH
ncbi:site-specific DNA-methyltransferase [Lysobacter sp. N42]|uniref:site-specific DNA-methyltransferase n=1 Tax=Lysobacter sp. N42 TaxID=2545719 RepID=UPI00104B27C2|nr:site-specific DNA-methyltransferase [Lysobacter sp. N42]TCZ87723.1 site-specific DNA-methyltransferase [Lysobacter sp. N42]